MRKKSILFSGNENPKGACLILDLEKKQLIKKWRCNDINNIHLTRTEELNSILKDKKNKNILLPYNENSVQTQKLIIGRSAYQHFRCFWGKSSVLSILKKTLDICVFLENSSDTPYLSLVHNDLAPSNIIVDNEHIYLCDWEYFSIDYYLFNYFDVLLNFFSIYYARLWKKRSVNDYANVFQRINADTNTNLFSILKKYLLKTINSSNIDNKSTFSDALSEYLDKKEKIQKTIYGVSGDMDIFWSHINRLHKKSIISAGITFFENIIR